MPDPVSDQVRQWHFDWRLLLFAGVFLPLLLTLGFWQLDRAAEKQRQLAQWETQSTEKDWPEHLESGLKAGQPVVLQGQYREEVTWLLDNRTRDGAPGYEVLTLFQPDKGASLVVNRGWVQAPRRREQLPDIATPTDSVTVSGRLGAYPQPPVLMDTSTNESLWPRRVQVLTRTDAESLSPGVAKLVLKLDGPEQPGAYRADWAPDRMGPQTHYGYAVQWFSLATALVILTLVASYRKTGNDNDNG